MTAKQTLYIDHMVCDRCRTAVSQIATNLGWRIERVELGRLTGWPPEDPAALLKIERQLSSVGFRLHHDSGGVVSRVKGLIIEHVYNDKADATQTLSELISSDIGQSYPHLSRLFSQEEGRTIVDFYGIHRMERGKQLLTQTDQPVSSIAYRLNYGSAGRFTAVFRKATGLSPTEFRSRGVYEAKPLDKL